MKRILCLATLLGCLLPFSVLADTIIYSVKTPTKALGKINFKETLHGVVLTPTLKGLSPGMHGVELRPGTSCDSQFLTPTKNPYQQPLKSKSVTSLSMTGGNKTPASLPKGILPPLFVNQQGQAQSAILLEKASMQAVHKHILLIYPSQQAQPYLLHPFYGGPIEACGVVN